MAKINLTDRGLQTLKGGKRQADDWDQGLPKNFDELYKEAEKDDEYWLAGVVQEFTEGIVMRMEHEGISRSELARRLGTSPAYITKILRGNVNFTLATMVRLGRALGTDLSVELQPAESVDHETSVELHPTRRIDGDHDRRATGLVAKER